MAKAARRTAKPKRNQALPRREEFALLAIKAAYERDFDSLVKLLRCFDKKELKKAVKEVLDPDLDGKINRFLETLILNSVRVTYQLDASASFRLERARKLVDSVIYFYYDNTSDPIIRALVEGMVQRKRHAMHMRLRRMSVEQVLKTLRPHQVLVGDRSLSVGKLPTQK